MPRKARSEVPCRVAAMLGTLKPCATATTMLGTALTETADSWSAGRLQAHKGVKCCAWRQAAGVRSCARLTVILMGLDELKAGCVGVWPLAVLRYSTPAVTCSTGWPSAPGARPWSWQLAGRPAHGGVQRVLDVLCGVCVQRVGGCGAGGGGGYEHLQRAAQLSTGRAGAGAELATAPHVEGRADADPCEGLQAGHLGVLSPGWAAAGRS